MGLLVHIYAWVHIENTARNLLDNAILFSNVFVIMYISNSCVWDWSLLHTCNRQKIFASLLSVKYYFFILVIWIPLITKEIEHIFTFIMAIWIFSFMGYLCSSLLPVFRKVVFYTYICSLYFWYFVLRNISIFQSHIDTSKLSSKDFPFICRAIIQSNVIFEIEVNLILVPYEKPNVPDSYWIHEPYLLIVLNVIYSIRL